MISPNARPAMSPTEKTLIQSHVGTFFSQNLTARISSAGSPCQAHSCGGVCPTAMVQMTGTSTCSVHRFIYTHPFVRTGSETFRVTVGGP
jgi:hypothetical protein